MSTDMETIGERLKAERLRLGLTQAEFGEALGVAKNVQSRYERGDRSPDPDYLAATARCGVDVLYVLTGDRVPVNAISLDAARVAAGQAYKAAQAMGGDLPVEKFERLFLTLCDTTAAREETARESPVTGVHKVVQKIGAGSHNVQIGHGQMVAGAASAQPAKSQRKKQN